MGIIVRLKEATTDDKFGPLVVDVSDVARLLPQCQLNGEKETKFRYESKNLKVREALNQ